MNIPELEFKDFIIKRAASKKEIGELVTAIQGLGKKNGVIQIFDKERIASRVHLFGAYANALIAFKNRTNRTKSMGMEMLLFAAMTGQIEEAIGIVGAKSSSDFILFADRKAAFARLKQILKIKSDFGDSAAHARSVAAGFGIRGSGIDGINARILQKMALSRLNSG
jgi:tRNA threonylcarbamoyladenosine modification (KEOPS) complex Cgi121 subunit